MSDIHPYPSPYVNVAVCADCGVLLAQNLAELHVCPKDQT